MTRSSPPERQIELLHLHGEVLRLECDDAGVARNLLRLLAHFGFERVEGEGSPGTRLSVRTAGAEIEVPHEARLAERFGPVEALRTEGSLWVRDEQTVARIDPLAGTGEIHLRPEPWTSRLPFAERRITLVMLTVMVPLRRRGLFGLHGAAVSRNGDGCLLVARGASGKSTLALHLALRGWDHLADDSFLVREGHESTEALSLRKHVYLAPEAADEFPGIGDGWRECPLKATPKRCLDLERVPATSTVGQCLPRWIVFPRLAPTRAKASSASTTDYGQPTPKGARHFSRGATRFSRVDAADALARLVAHSELIGLEPDLAAPQLETLRRLALQCGCWELAAGPELIDDSDRTAELFDRLIEQPLEAGESPT